jgi:hypothetical protein
VVIYFRIDVEKMRQYLEQSKRTRSISQRSDSNLGVRDFMIFQTCIDLWNSPRHAMDPAHIETSAASWDVSF